MAHFGESFFLDFDRVNSGKIVIKDKTVGLLPNGFLIRHFWNI